MYVVVIYSLSLSAAYYDSAKKLSIRLFNFIKV